MSKLETLIKNSTSKEECEMFLNICDDLHNNIPVDNFTKDDLPTKEFYNKVAKKAGHVNLYHRIRFENLSILHKFPQSTNIHDIGKCLLYPNFDGVNVCIEFVKIENIFKPTRAHIKNRDTTEKIIEMINNLTFTDEKTFKDVSKIVLTGVFMCKDRFIYEDGNSAINHYSIALNKINSSIDEFVIDLNRFDFLATEINYIIRNNSEYITTQLQTFQLFNKLNCNFKYIQQHNIFNGDYYKSDSTNVNFYETYLKILENENYPTNGIMYSSENYKYNSVFQNDKFIWLPPIDKQIRINSMTYEITKIGLNFKLKCDNVNLTAESEKLEIQISTRDLNKFIKSGLGENAICSYKINSNKIKKLSAVLVKSDKPFTIPKYCPKCKCELTQEYDRDELKRLKCENTDCVLYNVDRWYNFISRMNSLYKRKHNNETLPIYNEKGNKIKRMFNIDRFYEYSENQILSKDKILKICPTIFKEFENLKLHEQIFALGLCSTINQAEKEIIKNKYETLADIENVWIYKF